VQVRRSRREYVTHDGQAMPLFFNAAHLPPPTEEYVAWVDVMGTQASMSTSLRTTANFMFKLHIAAFQAPRQHVRIYPVMDGFYAAAPGKADMLNFLRGVFSALGHEFNVTEENRFRFIVRGGLAFGPSIHAPTSLQRPQPLLPTRVSIAIRSCLACRWSRRISRRLRRRRSASSCMSPPEHSRRQARSRFTIDGGGGMNSATGPSSKRGPPCTRTSRPTSTGAPNAPCGSATRSIESTPIG